MGSDIIVEELMMGLFLITIIIPIITVIFFIVFALVVDVISRDKLRRNLEIYNERNRYKNNQGNEPERLEKNNANKEENNIKTEWY